MKSSRSWNPLLGERAFNIHLLFYSCLPHKYLWLLKILRHTYRNCIATVFHLWHIKIFFFISLILKKNTICEISFIRELFPLATFKSLGMLSTFFSTIWLQEKVVWLSQNMRQLFLESLTNEEKLLLFPHMESSPFWSIKFPLTLSGESSITSPLLSFSLCFFLGKLPRNRFILMMYITQFLCDSTINTYKDLLLRNIHGIQIMTTLCHYRFVNQDWLFHCALGGILHDVTNSNLSRKPPFDNSQEN